MGFLDVVFLPSGDCLYVTFLKHCSRGYGIGTGICLRTVVDGKQGMLPVEYFCSNKSSFLCQSNFMEIIRLSHSWVNLAILIFLNVARFKIY